MSKYEDQFTDPVMEKYRQALIDWTAAQEEMRGLQDEYIPIGLVPLQPARPPDERAIARLHDAEKKERKAFRRYKKAQSEAFRQG